jgi:dihydrofolate reductase
VRKIVLFNMMTLDGFFAGPNGDIDWHKTDDEFNDFANEQLGQAGGLLFGRVTYQLMESYWPTATDDPEVARSMNELPKFVVSRTLTSVDWQNTTLLHDADAALSKLKEEPGSDLFLFGSANLAAALTEAGLIDEYRVMVSPMLLGSGRPLFEGGTLLDLDLLSTRPFRSGNVLLTYQRAA